MIAGGKAGTSTDAERDLHNQKRNELKFRLRAVQYAALLMPLCRHYST
jgi:hypothetical protein